MSSRSVTALPRVRLLIAMDSLDDQTWAEWQSARQASAHPRQIVLQRVSRGEAANGFVGVGYGESWRWFGPIDDGEKRRELVRYADAVARLAHFPEPSATLGQWLQASKAAEGSASGPTASAEGLVFLSHAETDLLALERARQELPVDFPAIFAHSLLGIGSLEQLVALIGERRSTRLFAIVRIHGTVSSVPGLLDLVGLAHREGWGLVVISGVGGNPEILPRTLNTKAELASNLTSYFMSGGAGNIANALRYAAAEQLGWAGAHQVPRAMPAHGLYHPDLLVTSTAEWSAHRDPERSTAIVLFYRAHVLSGNLRFIDEAIRTMERRAFAAIGVFTSSLRDRDKAGVPVALRLLPDKPDVIVNTISFPVFNSSSLEFTTDAAHCDAFESLGAPILQAICCGTTRALWQESARGLSPIEAAMNIALPECDGRVISVPVSFKENHRYLPDQERLERVADLAQRFSTLKSKPNCEKRVAIVLSNSAGKAQRIGGAVGLDTPASLLKWLMDLRDSGYRIGDLPATADELMARLLQRGCYDERHPLEPTTAWRLPREQYARWFYRQSAAFQDSLGTMWGKPATFGQTIAPPFWRDNRQLKRRSPLLALHEPHTDDEDYLFGGLQFGNVIVLIQPPRGFGVDPEAVYHAPDLPPCHHYAAFYRWLAESWRADALIHFGTHGTLEWLPGKSLAMSADCAPDALLGDMPLFYPFVINNPGEGAQAKRRTHAVIVDHLVPPLTHADSYGPLATLARLVEEYYRAEILDTPKLPLLRRQIWDLVRTAHLEEDLKQIRLVRHGNHEHPWDERETEEGIPRALELLSGRGFAHLLEDLDAYLCDLGRAQIRGGLHVFGEAPRGEALLDLLFAILKIANGSVPSLVDAIARACGIEVTAMTEHQGAWSGPRPSRLTSDVVTTGQVKTALDDLARDLLRGLAAAGFSTTCLRPLIERHFGAKSHAHADLERTLEFVCETLAPKLQQTTEETRQLLAGLNGAFVPAGPSGSPSRGMAHVLPTGRNFYTVDPRGLPTPAAWSTGEALAREALTRHFSQKGAWPESIALSIWGTPTMRTGGDDIAQGLALLGVRPLWEPETRRTCGLEVIPLLELRRPRIDVTLRVSGFFRDAFPALMHLFDEAVRRVLILDEPPEHNYVRKHWLTESSALVAQGCDSDTAQRRASYRVFSSKPGAYGTGLMQLMEASAWRDSGDLAEAVLLWGGWAYSPERSGGIEAVESFRRRLAGIELVVHNQDNLEQDLFDSTDYFEFHGGLVAAVAAISNRTPLAYFGDSSNPARPAVRTLQAEALRVYRARVVNPKWLGAIQRHGYRGGLEMAATVDSIFGFSATAGIVTDWMFEGIAENYADGAARDFLKRDNPWALNAIVERLLEAEQRKLWTAHPETLIRLRTLLLESEATVEEAAENPL